MEIMWKKIDGHDGVYLNWNIAEVTKLSNAFSFKPYFLKKRKKATRTANSLKVDKLSKMNIKTQQKQRE